MSGSSYVALLRGVNVGRHNRLAMSSLKELLEGLGYGQVRTHLQSGNAVFSTDRRSSDRVAHEVEEALAAKLDLPVKVLVRSRAELAAVVENNPWAGAGRDGSKLLVTFLSGKPDPEHLARLAGSGFAPEEYASGRQEIYLWCPNGLQNSALVKAFSDKRLGVTATTRNQNTVDRLLELSG